MAVVILLNQLFIYVSVSCVACLSMLIAGVLLSSAWKADQLALVRLYFLGAGIYTSEDEIVITIGRWSLVVRLPGLICTLWICLLLLRMMSGVPLCKA